MVALLVLIALLFGPKLGVLGIYNITIAYTDPSIVYNGTWYNSIDTSGITDSFAYDGSFAFSTNSAQWQFTGASNIIPGRHGNFGHFI